MIQVCYVGIIAARVKTCKVDAEVLPGRHSRAARAGSPWKQNRTLSAPEAFNPRVAINPVCSRTRQSHVTEMQFSFSCKCHFSVFAVTAASFTLNSNNRRRLLHRLNGLMRSSCLKDETWDWSITWCMCVCFTGLTGAAPSRTDREHMSTSFAPFGWNNIWKMVNWHRVLHEIKIVSNLWSPWTCRPFPSPGPEPR